MRRTVGPLVATLVLIAGTGCVQAQARNRSAAVTVKRDAQSPTCGIQEAIDALGQGGGIVVIPPGDYALRRSVQLRSDITLQGAGRRTVLRKNRQVGSRLAARSNAEARSLRVQDASGFRAGDEVGVFDSTTVGWLHAHVIVSAVQGDELTLDRRVGRAFDPADAAAVINQFPAITGRGMAHVMIKDLTIDGQIGANPGILSVSARAPRTPTALGFTFAAINVMEMTEGAVENVSVRGWPSDGISLQKGNHNRVTRCTVEACQGPGFHSGGGEVDTVFTGNEGRDNSGDGFYFCARVTRNVVRENRFVGNKENGIGGLGDGGDTANIVELNVCRANAQDGIAVWGGAGNTVRSNLCCGNSRAEPGRWNGITISRTTNTTVVGNRCFDDQPAKTQKHGIEELNDSSDNVIADNDCRRNQRAGLALAGRAGKHSGNRE